MLDHDTDSYYKISRAFVDGEPVGGLTRESIVDNITLYWLTGTGASAARWYWETGQAQAAARAAGQAPPAVSVPVGFTTFPGEIFGCPAQLGRDGLPRPRLLQRGRPGWPLRRLGGAAALLRRGPRRVPLTALIRGDVGARPSSRRPPDAAPGISDECPRNTDPKTAQSSRVIQQMWQPRFSHRRTSSHARLARLCQERSLPTGL